MKREPPTQIDGMEQDERRQGWYAKWGGRIGSKLDSALAVKPSRWHGGVKIFIAVAPAVFVGGTLLSLLVLAVNNHAGAAALQYWMAICGTLQIAAGAYLGTIRFRFLKNIANQERARKTESLRPIDNPRYLLDVIKVVDAFHLLPAADKKMGLSAYLKTWAETQEDLLKTEGGRLRLLRQEDLAILFMGASTNATYGTPMVVFSTADCVGGATVRMMSPIEALRLP